MKWIDLLLDRITMYRIVLYETIFLLVSAGVLGSFKLLPIEPLYLAESVFFILAVSWLINKLFAWAFDAPANPESTYITALILALIITPPTAFLDSAYLSLAFWPPRSRSPRNIFSRSRRSIFLIPSPSASQ